jgi:hypothetical protein
MRSDLFASAQLMSLESSKAMDICQICADICDACGSECGKHNTKHCQECAGACQECARRMQENGSLKNKKIKLISHG